MTDRFDRVNNRRGTHSMKWDVQENELPLWVADMDFQTAPCVIEALEEKVRTGIFGYSIVPGEWREAFRTWWKRRHRYDLDPEGLIFTTGVVAAVTTAVMRLTNTGDNVLIQTPVYNVFFNSIVNHGRHVLENELRYEEGRYAIDFVDLEEKLSHPLTTLMILCNPHNPIGKIWSREDLEKIGALCEKHHVTVVSDEIHCDLTDPGKDYIPFASVSETCAQNSVSCFSASKAFNLAGLQSAVVSVPNDRLRAIMERGLNSNEVAEPNAFAIESTIAAFTQGEAWLEELRAYLKGNKVRVRKYLEEELPEVRCVHSDATYLLWLDMSRIDEDASKIQAFLRERTGLYLSDGSQFGGNGRRFLRMNLACPASVLEEALKRLKTGLEAYTNNN